MFGILAPACPRWRALEVLVCEELVLGVKMHVDGTTTPAELANEFGLEVEGKS